MRSVKKLTVSAILTALCVIFLAGGSFVPNMALSFVAASALLPAVAVIQCGYFWAAAVYAASGLLALLLLPDKTCALWFLIVLGHYGIFKSLIERLKSPVIEWLLKILLFGALLLVLFFLFRTVFRGVLPQYSEWILLGGLLVCFVLYDIAYSALISFYLRRIRPHIK